MQNQKNSSEDTHSNTKGGNSGGNPKRITLNPGDEVVIRDNKNSRDLFLRADSSNDLSLQAESFRIGDKKYDSGTINF